MRMKQADKEAFEKKFPMPSNCIRCGDGYAATSYNAWGAQAYSQKWEGFKAGIAHARSGEPVAVTTVGQIEAMKNGYSRTITARDPSFIQFPNDNDVKLFTHNQPAETKDTERLDFLIEKGTRVCELHSENKHYCYANGTVHYGKNPRKAIDAAIKSQKEQL